RVRTIAQRVTRRGSVVRAGLGCGGPRRGRCRVLATRASATRKRVASAPRRSREVGAMGLRRSDLKSLLVVGIIVIAVAGGIALKVVGSRRAVAAHTADYREVVRAVAGTWPPSDAELSRLGALLRERQAPAYIAGRIVFLDRATGDVHQLQSY